jgi:hypothetical protein
VAALLLDLARAVAMAIIGVTAPSFQEFSSSANAEPYEYGQTPEGAMRLTGQAEILTHQ